MSSGFLYTALAFQSVLMAVDEFYFHRRRRLPAWERWGHPLDSLVFSLALLAIFYFGPTVFSIGLGIFSCVLITKDEWVHAKECQPSEQWLHAMLFVLHPVVLILAGLSNGSWGPEVPAVVFIFCLYQTIYWNFYAHRSFAKR